MNNLGEIQRDPDIDLDIAVINNGFQSTFSRSTAMILFSVNKLSITDIFFFFDREAMVTSVWQNPKIKNQGGGYNSTCDGNWDFIWKNFYCTQIFFFILSDVYVALWDVLDVLKYEWNQSDISLKLFNAYTQMLRVYVHNVIISAFQ